MIDDSLLRIRRTESRIFRPDNFLERCVLPGAKIKDVIERFMKKQSIPLLIILFFLFYVGMNETVKSLKTRQKSKISGSAGDVSSVLPTNGQHPVRKHKSLEVNCLLKGWCH